MAVWPCITIDKFVLFRVPCDTFVTAIASEVALTPFSTKCNNDLSGRALKAATTKLPAFFVVMLLTEGFSFEFKVFASRKGFETFHADKVLLESTSAHAFSNNEYRRKTTSG